MIRCCHVSFRHLWRCALIFSLFVLAACSSSQTPSGELGAACESDMDCDPGLACNSQGQCITVECDSADDCQSGYTCIGYRCVILDDEPDTCTSNADCPTGYYCDVVGQCWPSNEPTDGDTPDGDDPDGDTPDGDNVDGDIPDGDGADGDVSDGDFDGDFNLDGEFELPPDSDEDGLPDPVEDRNGNGVWDPGETDLHNPDTDEDGLLDGTEDQNHDGTLQFNETDPLNSDSDFDKLPDGVEDDNQNGELDPGETDPLNPDTDEDGVIDGDELSGGYTNGNSDPLDRDTDDDTLPDGIEDKNHNGIYEPLLGETDPTMVDSDGDQIPDNEESVSQICLEDQITDIVLYENFDADYTLALLPDFSHALLGMNPAPQEILHAAAFEWPSHPLAGFLLVRPLSAATAEALVSADNPDLESGLVASGGLNHRGRTYSSYDGYSSMTSRYSLTTTSQTVGALRNKALSILSDRTTAQIDNLPAGPSDTSTQFEIVMQTLVRDDRSLTLFAVASKSEWDNSTTPAVRLRMTDLTDGSALSHALRDTTDSCDPFAGAGQGLVDFIWVVDDSGSMDEDQQAVSDAAALFAQIMTSAGIDFRVAVTSTDCLGECPPLIEAWWPWMCADYTADSGRLGEYNFTRDMAEFQSDVNNPPCSSSEYGLKAGHQAIERALNTQLPENERFRSDASRIIIWLSDEEDQEYEDCNNASCENNVLVNYRDYYDSVQTTCFAIVGDTPNGCGTGSSDSGPGSGEAGTAYIDIAYHTGGVFGSICSPDLTPTMEEILRAAAGTASSYELVHHPISSTIQVVVEGVEIARSQSNGFEYDAVSETIVFYGDARPEEGNDVVMSYRFFVDDPKE